ncbi:hypothetical protein FRX31_005836 [Thalictrum thalictroides]|uniref:Uncharacterized protein n=1 Tax=Thalictrum thalictroides TaxID=46969 RepID=A0A7J6X6S1_THATH|nr:hypothetical protein FRX31_005836 [Thalictrum thalictroides]
MWRITDCCTVRCQSVLGTLIDGVIDFCQLPVATPVIKRFYATWPRHRTAAVATMLWKSISNLMWWMLCEMRKALYLDFKLII